MLTLKQVTWTAPGGSSVLKGIDLVVPDHKLVVITGPNGGGKTTLAKLISGLEKPDSGRIYLNETDITDLDVTQRARMGISYAFQQPVRFKGLTVANLLELAAGKTLSEDEACGYLVQVGLCARDYINREVNATLSGGEIKRIELATVLARHSKLSVFDEPEAGIDLWSFHNLIGVFQAMKESQSGTSVIISHQERILAIADEIVVIADGQITKQGPASEILPQLLAQESGCPQCMKKEIDFGGQSNE